MENRRKLASESKPKARAILRAAHQILQTHDTVLIQALCQDIQSNASKLHTFCVQLRTQIEQTKVEEFPAREGMEGL